MIRKILVPLDGSAFAEQALATAAMVGARAAASASIELVYADSSAGRAGRHHGNPADRIYINGIAEEATRLLGMPVTGIVVDGNPVDAIICRADVAGADLIVMSTHGRTGISRALLGSVADGVVRESGRPVLLHRPAAGAGWRTAVPRGFERILVPLDGTDDATTVMRPVLDLSRWLFAHPLLARVVLPVVDVMFSDAGVPINGLVDEESTRFLVDRAQAELTELALDVETRAGVLAQTAVVVDRDVARALLGLARENRADLIALFTHARGASRILAGSVTDRLLRESGLPLLVLHPRTGATPRETAGALAESATF